MKENVHTLKNLLPETTQTDLRIQYSPHQNGISRDPSQITKTIFKKKN